MRIALINNAVVENIIVSDMEFAQSLGYDLVKESETASIGDTVIGDIFVPPPLPPAPPAPPPPSPIITKIAMLTRLTDAEYVGILMAAKTDVEVEAWKTKFDAAGTINLEDSRTLAGINLLVTKNLLTQARADAILTDPVQDSERP